jgi:hypothetical protein
LALSLAQLLRQGSGLGFLAFRFGLILPKNIINKGLERYVLGADVLKEVISGGRAPEIGEVPYMLSKLREHRHLGISLTSDLTEGIAGYAGELSREGAASARIFPGPA